MKTSSLLKPRESLGTVVKHVLPDIPYLQVEQLEVTPEGLLIRASSTQAASYDPPVQFRTRTTRACWTRASGTT